MQDGQIFFRGGEARVQGVVFDQQLEGLVDVEKGGGVFLELELHQRPLQAQVGQQEAFPGRAVVAGFDGGQAQAVVGLELGVLVGALVDVDGEEIDVVLHVVHHEVARLFGAQAVAQQAAVAKAQLDGGFVGLARQRRPFEVAHFFRRGRARGFPPQGFGCRQKGQTGKGEGAQQDEWRFHRGWLGRVCIGSKVLPNRQKPCHRSEVGLATGLLIA